MNGGWERFVPFVALLLWAAIEDARSRRVPNWISFSLMLGGILLSAAPWGHLRFTAAAAGLGTGFGLCLVLYLFRAVGAGDVKLVAGVGAWIGAMPVVVVFAVAALLGMSMALWTAAGQRKLSSLLRNGAMLGASLSQGSVVGISAATAGSDASGVSGSARQRGLPFAVAIAVATCMFIVVREVTSGGK